MKDLKESFSRWYNRSHGRRGFFWGERFKSVIVESGDALLNCLAYIDLNAVRAGIVERPEEYRWCSLAWHLQTGNESEWLSLDLGLTGYDRFDGAKRLRQYRRFVYEAGALPSAKGARIPGTVIEKEEAKDFAVGGVNRLLLRTRYFTDSGVIGSKDFVSRCYKRFETHFTCRHEKRPRPIVGLEGVFSLKRLSAMR